MKPTPHHNSGSRCQRGDGVKIGLQDKWYLIDQYVADHSAPDSCQHAKQCSHHWIQARCKCFLRPGDSKPLRNEIELCAQS